MSLRDLPLLNALINTTVACLLVIGRILIARHRRKAHRAVMIGAVGLSTLFLASYVAYHLEHGATRFAGTGNARTVYFAILGSHTVLAAVALPAVVLAFVHALRGRFAAHRKVARLAWWVWLYVASTWPVVYWMLHRMGKAS